MRDSLRSRTSDLAGESQRHHERESQVAVELQRYYDTPAKLTLGKLRVILQSLAELVTASAGRPPSVAEISSVVHDHNLGDLPFGTIAALVDAVMPAIGKDILAAFTLKQLEELLSRIELTGHLL